MLTCFFLSSSLCPAHSPVTNPPSFVVGYTTPSKYLFNSQRTSLSIHTFSCEFIPHSLNWYVYTTLWHLKGVTWQFTQRVKASSQPSILLCICVPSPICMFQIPPKIQIFIVLLYRDLHYHNYGLVFVLTYVFLFETLFASSNCLGGVAAFVFSSYGNIRFLNF